LDKSVDMEEDSITKKEIKHLKMKLALIIPLVKTNPETSKNKKTKSNFSNNKEI
jgi:hypothetical protein